MKHIFFATNGFFVVVKIALFYKCNKFFLFLFFLHFTAVLLFGPVTLGINSATNQCVKSLSCWSMISGKL